MRLARVAAKFLSRVGVSTGKYACHGEVAGECEMWVDTTLDEIWVRVG